MTGLQKAVENFLLEAQMPRTIPYLDLPFPAPIDTAGLLLTEAYSAATNESRIDAQNLLKASTASSCLHAFSLRAATQAVRRGEFVLVAAGITALVIEDCHADYRETIMLSTVMVDAAVRIGLDPKDELNRAAAAATTLGTADSFTHAARRYMITRKCYLMGYRTYGKGEDFSYY